MSEEWQSLIRNAILVVIFFVGIVIVIKVFGGNIRRDLEFAIRREFRTRMGIISIIGVSFFVLLTIKKDLAHLFLFIATPKSSAPETFFQYQFEILVLFTLIAFISNLVFIARISLK